MVSYIYFSVIWKQTILRLSDGIPFTSFIALMIWLGFWVQTYLGDIAASVPIFNNISHISFCDLCSLVHIKVMFPLYYCVLRVQSNYVQKSACLNKKYFTAKNANHHLTKQDCHNIQFVKNAISAKHSRMKCNKKRNAWTMLNRSCKSGHTSFLILEEKLSAFHHSVRC